MTPRTLHMSDDLPIRSTFVVQKDCSVEQNSEIDKIRSADTCRNLERIQRFVCVF